MTTRHLSNKMSNHKKKEILSEYLFGFSLEIVEQSKITQKTRKTRNRENVTFNQSISERHVGKTEKRLREFLTFLSVSDEDEDEQMRLFLLISEQCLPKLVCELYSKPFDASFTDSEKSLMGLIG